MKRALLWILAVAMIAFGTVGLIRVAEAQTNCDVTASDLSVSADEQRLLSLINDYRVSLGIAPLAQSSAITRPSAWMAADLATRADKTFSHTDSSGRLWQRFWDCGISQSPGMYLGENIAAGYTSPDSTFLQWKNSPAHDANMKNAVFTTASVGMRFESSAVYRVYWVLDLSSVVETIPTPTAIPQATITPVPTATPAPTPGAGPYWCAGYNGYRGATQEYGFSRCILEGS